MIALLPLVFGLVGVGPADNAEPLPAALEHTAVVIALERNRLPGLSAMQTWFTAGDERLRVLAVEKGPAEVVVVRDPAVQQYLDRLVVLPTLDSELRAARIRLRTACNLGDDAGLRFVSPMAAPVSRTTGLMSILMRSPSFQAGKSGFLAFVGKLPGVSFVPRVADAVWMAGHELNAKGYRRAVLIWVDGRSHDESQHPAASVLAVLKRLQVPSFLWSFGPGPFVDAWQGRLISQTAGRVEPRSDLERFNSACAEARSALEGQRIVWIEGNHVPSKIRLTPEADGVRLAGSLPKPLGADGPETAIGRPGGRP